MQVRRFPHLFLFAFLIIHFCFSCLSGQTVIELKRADKVFIPGKLMAVYEDATAKKNIQDIASAEGLKLFKSATVEVPNFNVTSSAVWCRFLFTSREQGPWLLEMGNPATKVVDVYTRISDTKFKFQSLGLFNRKETKPLSTFHIFSHLDFNAGDTLEVFVKIQDVAPLQAFFYAGYSERFFEADHTTNLFHGVFYGIMLLMTLYNLFLFITNRDRVYIYYVLYIFFNTLFISFFLGHVALLPEVIKNSVLFKVPVIIPALFGSFGALFTMQFLHTKRLLPRTHRVLWINIVLAMCILTLSIFGFPRASLYAIQFLGLVLATCSIITGVSALKKCFRPAGFYLAGYGVYLLGLLVLIVADLDILPLFVESRYILESGAIMEAVILSFAIGDKLNSSNKEKNIAKEQALQAAMENARLIREQNAMLEQKVEERTRELNLQKEIVEEKNKDIIASIEYAKRIQRSLLPHEKYLERTLAKLKKKG